MRLFRFSPIALLLALFMYSTAIALGTALGSWVIPLILALLHEGTAGLAHVGRTEMFFGALPSWIVPGSVLSVVVQVLHWTAVVLGLVLAMVAAQRWFRYLAVVRLKWMTAEEFEEFERRAGDD
jgi:hypothetical protein